MNGKIKQALQDAVANEDIQEYQLQDEIPMEVFREALRAVLRDHEDDPYVEYFRCNSVAVFSYNVSEYIGLEKVTKKGKFSKRLKVYTKEYCPELTPYVPEICNQIGALSVYSSVHMEISEIADWDSGDFGDDGSCFWGSNEAARLTLNEHPDFFPIKLYRKSVYNDRLTGYARCWSMYRDSFDGLIIFNAYSDDDKMKLTSFATLLCERFGFTNRTEIELRNFGSTTGTLYLNSGHGIALHNGDCPLDEGDTYDFRIDCDAYEDEYRVSCECCGEYGNAEDMTYLEMQEGYICDYCLRTRYTRCEGCGEYIHDDYIREYHGYSYCEACYDTASTCPECEVAPNEDVRYLVICDDTLDVEVSEEEACSADCLVSHDDNYTGFNCALCGDSYAVKFRCNPVNEEVYIAGDKYHFCPECFENHGSEYPEFYDIDYHPMYHGYNRIKTCACGTFVFPHIDVNGNEHTDKCILCGYDTMRPVISNENQIEMLFGTGNLWFAWRADLNDYVRI